MSYVPPANKDTFKDLLIFEERLKQNSERLQRQRIKYEAFLLSLIMVTIILAYKSFLAVSPYKVFHYLYVGLLLVAITTLILFFVTGMYTDTIAYAYKFIPQTNRALRPFNMFLNAPPPSPLTSPFQLLVSPKEPLGNVAPPLVNPRGELLFSSKVSTPFIDGYERYRTEWERRRPPPPTLLSKWRPSPSPPPARTSTLVKKPVSRSPSRASTPDLLVDEAPSEASLSSAASPVPPPLSSPPDPISDDGGEWCTVRR
ncbi:hypothetical protein CROQUDRAFT_655734 [Cronartium quercuum f. sp. fusiforme G11]|uniref:Transmembrane protein 188 n=1 Tax=Cronartium quercuum f. sp. fusiforme G11 TaxID=708437 RepID=A0A9P6TCW6_9BASI|nr:hypothetical protein CROQUDRAFT_655734 [Cronartium quercuum f. sp. fusiforme G11]